MIELIFVKIALSLSSFEFLYLWSKMRSYLHSKSFTLHEKYSLAIYKNIVKYTTTESKMYELHHFNFTDSKRKNATNRPILDTASKTKTIFVIILN